AQSAGGYVYSRYIARCFQKSEIELARHQMCLGSPISSLGPTRAPGAYDSSGGGAIFSCVEGLALLGTL
ncbi:hypothetical protein HAX54_044673, partial [Datura stramonium]|nr:hypothetical protein [Datura stramonium]